MKTLISRLCGILSSAIMMIIIITAGGIMLLSVLGRKPMAVLSGSMEPAYNVGGLVFIDTTVAPEEIKTGDVITYELSEDTVVTHRVTAIAEAERQFTTKGDANNSEDLSPVPFDHMVGRAWLHIPKLGYALMELKTRKGFAAGALILATLIVLFIIPVLLAPPKRPPGEPPDPPPAKRPNPAERATKGGKRYEELTGKAPALTRTAKVLMILALAAVAAAVAVLTVTATLGYLTSRSSQATNTATFGSIGLSSPEPSSGPMQTPEPGGAQIPKNPTVKNETGTPAYIRARVVDGGVWEYYTGESKGFNTAHWVDNRENDGYFYYRKALTGGEGDTETPPIFTSVKLKKDANISDAGQLNIIVYAEAVQQWVDTSDFKDNTAPWKDDTTESWSDIAKTAYKSFEALNNPADQAEE